MADKSTRLIIDALCRAAADPAGSPLVAGKSESGLFPATALARTAAERCKAEGLLQVVRSENKGKGTREPVRPDRQGHGVPGPRRQPAAGGRRLRPRPGSPPSGSPATARRRVAHGPGIGNHPRRPRRRAPPARRPARHARPADGRPTRCVDRRHQSAAGRVARGGRGVRGLPAAGAVRPARSAASRPASSTTPCGGCTTTGRSHLHPWTGPLYALPEPAFALLVGHEVAYYASIR